MAIFKASGGIPRRINSVCDRLLLAGFLAAKTHLGQEEVDEVVREFAQEADVPLRPATHSDAELAKSSDHNSGGPTSVNAGLDVDLTQVQLDGSSATTISRQLSKLAGEHRGDQLQRLERGMLRLERTNLQLLTLMQQLVTAVKKPVYERPQADSGPLPPSAPVSQLGAGPELAQDKSS